MKYYSPKTLEETVNIIDEYKETAALVAGCTEVLNRNDFFNNKKAIINTTEIQEIKQIEDLGYKIRIGAGVTFSEILNSKIIQDYNLALFNAVKVFGSTQIRNRATIAGNIANASPAADSLPPLIISNATLSLMSTQGKREIKLKDLIYAPGKTTLKPHEIITFIEFEKDKPQEIIFFRKIGTRKALSIAKASVAFKANCSSEKLSNVNIAYGSVGPTVIISKNAKKVLEKNVFNINTVEHASIAAFEEVSPITDIRSTASYRKIIIKNILIEELSRFCKEKPL